MSLETGLNQDLVWIERWSLVLNQGLCSPAWVPVLYGLLEATQLSFDLKSS